MDEDP
jgi:hypothetical protein